MPSPQFSYEPKTPAKILRLLQKSRELKKCHKQKRHRVPWEPGDGHHRVPGTTARAAGRGEGLNCINSGGTCKYRTGNTAKDLNIFKQIAINLLYIFR